MKCSAEENEAATSILLALCVGPFRQVPEVIKLKIHHHPLDHGTLAIGMGNRLGALLGIEKSPGSSGGGGDGGSSKNYNLIESRDHNPPTPHENSE